MKKTKGNENMKEIIIGASLTCETVVSEDKLAVNVGSGDMRVFATPMMAALMEKAAAECLGGFLGGDETSVGTRLEISHDAPTPLGMKVTVTAEILEANGRKIIFSVSASDEKGVIGSGRHERFVVYREKFQAKADAKR